MKYNNTQLFYCLIILLPIQLACGAASAETIDKNTFDFNGLRLGSSLVSTQHRFPEFSCFSDREKSGLQHCKALINFNRHPGVLYSSQANVLLTFRQNQLTKIAVAWNPTLFKQTVSNFKKHYGKPTKVADETLTTVNGDTLENVIYSWHRNRESIVYQQYSGDEKTSMITYSLQRPDEANGTKNREIIVNWNDIAGKTAKGKDMIHEYSFKDYFSKNGKLLEVREDGSRHRGTWKISDTGYLCYDWKKSYQCGQLKVDDKGRINFMRYNTVLREFHRIDYGNK